MATISHKIDIDAPRDRVFAAVTTRDGLRGWYTADIDGDVVEGGEATFRFSGRRPFRWRFTDITPDTEVRWQCVEGPAKGTSVVYRLSDAGDGTTVELDHKDWEDGHEALTTCNTLWGVLMHHLRQYSETQTPSVAFA